MATRSTFLAPGQRYVESGFPDWRIDRQLTILSLLPDPEGELLVASRRANGEGAVEPVARLEAAVVAGHWRPVVGSGQLARC